MISIRKPGGYMKVGLNLCFGRGHIAVHWAWFSFERHEGWYRGFTVSRRGFRRRAARWNVVDEHLRATGMSAVCTEVLADLKAGEEADKRVNERVAYIKPQAGA